MVRVSGSASKSFIEYFALLTTFILPVLEAEQAVESARLSLGTKAVDAGQQIRVVSKTLAALKDLISKYCDEAATAWSLEDWSEGLWSLVETATSHSLSGQSCSEFSRMKSCGKRQCWNL